MDNKKADQYMDFPKQTNQNQKGQIGETAFECFVRNHLGCIWHKVHQENDFGIDGYIEIVKDGNVTGKLIGVQIKCGESYFKTKTDMGYKFIGENKHLNYYLNNPTPIIIVIMDGDSDEPLKRAYWNEFYIMGISSYGEDKWWINIPYKNELYGNLKEYLFFKAEPIIDHKKMYSRRFKYCVPPKDKYRFLYIEKSIIDYKQYRGLLEFIHDNSNTETSINKFRSSYGFDLKNFPNEFENVDLLSWLKESIYMRIPWFYFLFYDYDNNALNILLHAFCVEETSIICGNPHKNIYTMNYSTISVLNFLSFGLQGLQAFLSVKNIKPEICIEIYKGILQYYADFIGIDINELGTLLYKGINKVINNDINNELSEFFPIYYHTAIFPVYITYKEAYEEIRNNLLPYI